MKIMLNFKTLSVLLVLLIMVVVYVFTGNNSTISDIEPRQITSQEGVKIIAFGDSLTAGYGLPFNDAYPAQLETRLEALGFTTNVINSGVSGETTRGNLERAEFIRKQNPDIVLLGIGGNDALRLLPLEDTRKNIKETISILQSGENPPVIVLLQMKGPLNAGLSYATAFKEMYEELADEFDLVLVPFITVELFLKSEYKLPDGIHYNKAGYGQVVELYLEEPVSKIIQQITK